MESSGHTNFIDAFTSGSTFFSANQGEIRCNVIPAGELVIVSGKVLACDPGSIHYQDHTPFKRRIQPGCYPVLLSIAHLREQNTQETRIAAAKLQFIDKPVIKWEIALITQSEISQLRTNKFFGYGVGSGMGCFVDTCALEKFSSDQLEAVIERELFSDRDFNWKNFTLDPDTNANLIAFSSGYGDDIYSSYWGLTASGEVACLVTDFRVLVKFIETEVSIPNIPKYIDQQIENHQLKKLKIKIKLTQKTPAWAIEQMRRFGTFDFNQEDIYITNKQKNMSIGSKNTQPAMNITNNSSIYRLGIEGTSECTTNEITVTNLGKTYLARQQLYQDNHWYLQYDLEEPLQPDAAIIIHLSEGIVPLQLVNNINH